VALGFELRASCIIGRQVIFKFKNFQLMQSMFSDANGIRLEIQLNINNIKYLEKFPIF
jgi:hypothetical protein